MSDPTAMTPDCPVCTSTMVPHFRTAEGDYTLCPRCDYVRAWPVDVDALSLNVSLYNEKFDQNLEETSAMNEKRRRKYRRLMKQVEGYRDTGRFLDIGCGSGRLLEVAVDNGWEGWGSDPAMDNAADRDSKFKIVPRVVNECGFDEGAFDVVHANEVIEHIGELRPFVQEVARVLRPGGVAIFRTPHHRSWTAQMVKADWRQYEVFEKGHVGFVTPKTMAYLFEQFGMRLAKVSTHHFSLRDRYRPSQPLRLILGRAYALLGLVAKAVNRGERLTVWGVKQPLGAVVASSAPIARAIERRNSG